MRLKRVSAAVAMGAAAALALAACAPGGPATPSSSGSGSAGGSGSGAPAAAQVDGSGKLELGDLSTQSGKEIKISVGSTEYKGFNTSTALTYDTYSTAVSALYSMGFYYYGTDGKPIQNKDLGSYEKVSDSPLTVKYTISENAKWSDGTPITTADAIMAWGAQNSALVGSDGKTPVFNNVSGDLVSQVPKGPEGDPKGKTFTLTYKDPNPDWQLQTLMDYPAHVVAKQSGMSVDDLVSALRAQDKSKLSKAGEFWSKGWNPGLGQLPPEGTNVVNGPFILDSWDKGQSVTLKANPEYYGKKPGVEKITFRFVDPGAMVQALQNGDLDVMSPQPTVDTLKQLQALGSQVKIYQGDTMTWEHVDFNFAGTSVFKDSADLRKAFAMCIPREQIVKNLVQPINPEATVLNTRDTLPGQEGYDDVLKASYNGEYDKVDIEKSKEMVAKAGKSGKVKVRIGYNSPNPRRANEVQLIKASCDQAGFDVEDISSANFSDPGGKVESNDYDAFLFAWAGSGQLASGSNIYSSKKPQNFGKYSNKNVDEAFKKIETTTDMSEHIAQEKIVEKELWDDMFGIPIFQHPGLDAADAGISNMLHNASQSGISWNADQWQTAK